MIDKITYTKEHLLSLVKKYKTDPQLLERAIFALGLLEAISKVSKDFCFKGGSSANVKNDKTSSDVFCFWIKSQKLTICKK